MSERFLEHEPNEPIFNRIVIIDALQEIGIDVDLADWMGLDDAQILAHLVTYSSLLRIGIEDLFEVCHIEIESIGGENEV